MFIPDPGYTIIEFDLARADAQVVAWDSGDEPLKRDFKEGLDIHTENAISIWGGDKESVKVGGTNSQRQKAKVGIHAVDYYCKAKTLAEHLQITVPQAQDFINRWFLAHPAISDWHKAKKKELYDTRCVWNKFGYRMYFFDRVENCLPEALAWIAQSTVAIVTHKGMIKISKLLPEVQLLLEVHDSLVMQAPITKVLELAPKIKEAMQTPVPYADPLTINVDMKLSDISWGDVVPLEKYLKAA
jgi:DNA polymerase-1